MRQRSTFLLVLTLTVLVSWHSAAQEIEATVTLNTELLPPEEAFNLETFRSDLEYYINNSQFTDQEWEGAKIPVTIMVYFTSGSDGRYTARLSIAADRYLGGSLEHRSPLCRIVDPQWHFFYRPNTVLTYQPSRFDPLSSLIDFYMLLVIGMDGDSYAELGGSAAYRAAYRIWELGNATQYPGFERSTEPGEYSKYQIIAELTSAEFEDLRRLIFQYYADGLDTLATDPATAQQVVDAILSEMVRWKHRLGKPSVLLRLFFDTKVNELIDLFRTYEKRREVVQKLQYLDPGHSLDYQQLLR